MKNYFLFGVALCSAVVLSSCKSQESAYRQAYEKAKAQEREQTAQDNSEAVAVTPATGNSGATITVTPVTTVPSNEEDNSDVRTLIIYCTATRRRRKYFSIHLWTE